MGVGSVGGVSASAAARTSPLGMTRMGGLQMFTNANIQSAVNSALAELEANEGKKNWAAVVHHVYNSDGTRVENVTKVSVAVKIKDNWSIAAGAFKDWTKGELGAEAKVVISG